MAGRKNRPVLYEIVRRSHRAGEPSAPPRPSLLAGWFRPRPAEPEPPRPVPEPGFDVPPPSRTADRPRRAGAVRMLDGRLYLALGWESMLVAGVLLVLLLCVAFYVGKQVATQHADLNTAQSKPTLPSAPRPTTPPAQGSPGSHERRGTPGGAAEHASEPPQVPPGRPTPAPGGGGVTVPPVPTGSGPPVPPAAENRAPATIAPGYYVIVQHFREARGDDAKAGLDLLKSKNIDAFVLERGHEILLIAAEHFETDAAAAKLRDEVRKLGSPKLVTGTYKFTDAYVKHLSE